MAHPEPLTQLAPADFGPFGHLRQRRLGLRVPVHCWARLSGDSTSAYALAVELSPTGIVLKLVGRHDRLMSRAGQLFGLELFVPGAGSTVRVGVRRVRYIGRCEAFELTQVSATDRLTLAEYLDRMTASDSAPPFAQRSAR